MLFLHLLAQAQRAHVRPDFVDISKAFGLGASLANCAPAAWDFLVFGPDRILLLMIDNNGVDCGFVFFPSHGLFPFLSHSGGVSRSAAEI